MDKRPKKVKKGTVYIPAHKSLLKEPRPEIFLEGQEFYSNRYCAQTFVDQNNANPNRTCKWDVITIKFTAEIEK